MKSLSGISKMLATYKSLEIANVFIIIDNEDKQNNSCNIFILGFGDCGHDLHNTQICIYIYIMIL